MPKVLWWKHYATRVSAGSGHNVIEGRMWYKMQRNTSNAELKLSLVRKDKKKKSFN